MVADKLLELEKKLNVAIQSKYPGCTATYMTSFDGYGISYPMANDTPATILITRPNGLISYICCTDFAELIQEYRAELSMKLGIETPTDHILVTGRWFHNP